MPVSSVSVVGLPSWSSDLDDLAKAFDPAEEDHLVLSLRPGWSSRWLVRVETIGGTASFPCAGLGDHGWAGSRPVRGFVWKRNQRHRPGLHYMQSTGRHHGFESLEEQRLLLVADFLGLVDVVSQPFELRFETEAGLSRHIPDFLMLRADGAWLVDVRPAGQIHQPDRVKFAAAAEVALLAGWRFTVVTGWKSGVLACIEALSAQRRAMSDPLGLQPLLLGHVAGGPVLFGELVAAAPLPVLARAHALHLLWSRKLGLDLSRVLSDRSMVWPAKVGTP